MEDRQKTEGLRDALRDRYDIKDKIGEGGMATVFVATDLQHNREVAVKVLRPEVASALGHERFLAEISVVSGLTDPHILPLYDSGEAAGFPYYVMPLVEGESLRDLLDREGQLPIEDTLKIAEGIAAALGHAHSRGVLHRDIKPENVLLSGGEAIVADFGIALALTEAGGERLTETGMVIGTPEYMSPEQAAGESRLDERTDVYALATIVYEALAGNPPFQGLNSQAILARRLTESPPSLRTVRDSVPPEAEQVILKALAKVPADRHRSAQQFITELKQAFATGTSPFTAARPAASGSRPTKRIVQVAAAVIVVGAASYLGIQALKGGAAPTGPVSENLVAVMPFAVTGSDESAYLGEGVMSLLNAAFDGAGDLTTVDSRATLSRIGDNNVSGYDAEHAIAAGLGAGLWVSGRVVALGDNVRIVANMNSDDPALNRPNYDVEGPVNDLSSLVEQLAVDMLQDHIGQGANPSQVRVRLSGTVDNTASPLTDSLEALKEYLQAQDDMRAGRYNSAIPKYQRAVAIDTTFAAAYHRLSKAAWSARRDDLSGPAAERAVDLIDRLSSHDSLLVTAFVAYRQGRANEANGIYRSLVQRFPTDVEAWYMLGETIYHLGPLNGQPTSLAKQPFVETLLLEPTHRGAMGHLAGIAASEGDLVMADTLSAKYLRVHPDADLAVWMEMLRAIALGDSTARASVDDKLDAGQATPLDLMFAAVFYRDFDLASEFAEGAAGPDRNVMERLGGFGFGAFLQTAGGRLNAAREELNRIDAIIPGLPLKTILEANLAILPQIGYTPEELRRIYDRLGTLIPQSQPEARQILYLKGMIAAATDDAASANEFADALDTLTTGDPSRRNVEQARTVRARLLSDEGRSQEALDLLSQNRYEVEEVISFDDPTATLMHSRFLMAELLAASGRDEDALNWYASTADGVLPLNPGFEVVYLPLAHERRGEIYARMGEPGLAADQFGRFLDMMQGADLSLQPLVEDVRSRLQSVTSR